MNCEAAQQLLSAERDTVLGADVRRPLEEHLTDCAACRKMRAVLVESAAAWRTTTAAVRVPDERLEWQRVKRRLDGDAKPAARPAWKILPTWRGAMFAGAVALAAAGVFMVQPWTGAPSPIATEKAITAKVARADSVEVGGDASAMVYVDDKSGWLVVWAGEPGKG